MRHGSGDHAARPPRIARIIRVLSIPIILFWLGIAIILNVVTPSLDEVGKAHSVSMSPKDAPSMIAMMHTGKVFGEFDSDSSVMIVLEGKQELADEAHRFYDEIIKKLKADPTHVQHISDYWGDPLTASGAQSADGKAAYVQVNLAGDQGTTLANESVDAVRKIIAETPGPDGVQAYVTGGTAASADTGTAGNKSMQKTTLIAVGVVVVMLLFVYRSVITMFVALVIVGVLCSAVAAYFYVRVIVSMFFAPSPADAPDVLTPSALTTVPIGVCATLTALLGFFPQPLRLLPASIALGLDLQAKIWHESTAIHLDAKVVQIAQFVVDRLGAVLLSQEASGQFVEDRLSMFHGDRPQVARRECALVILEPRWNDQGFERHGRVRGILGVCWCCCSCIFKFTTTTLYRFRFLKVRFHRLRILFLVAPVPACARIG